MTKRETFGGHRESWSRARRRFRSNLSPDSLTHCGITTVVTNNDNQKNGMYNVAWKSCSAENDGDRGETAFWVADDLAIPMNWHFLHAG
eukprot:scaffold10570_cov176-Amphora_coffeaeformis.AAC.39